MSLRMPENEGKYKQFVADGGLEHGCVLCKKEPVLMFTYWKIVPNSYPYDRIAKTHDMIMPIRHAKETELTDAEWREFEKISAEYLHPVYEYLVESTHKSKSLPEHYHLHLIVTTEPA